MKVLRLYDNEIVCILSQFLLDDIADKLMAIVMEDHGSRTKGDSHQSCGQGMGRNVIIGEVSGLRGVHECN